MFKIVLFFVGAVPTRSGTAGGRVETGAAGRQRGLQANIRGKDAVHH